MVWMTMVTFLLSGSFFLVQLSYSTVFHSKGISKKYLKAEGRELSKSLYFFLGSRSSCTMNLKGQKFVNGSNKISLTKVDRADAAGANPGVTLLQVGQKYGDLTVEEISIEKGNSPHPSDSTNFKSIFSVVLSRFDQEVIVVNPVYITVSGANSINSCAFSYAERPIANNPTLMDQFCKGIDPNATYSLRGCIDTTTGKLATLNGIDLGLSAEELNLAKVTQTNTAVTGN